MKLSIFFSTPNTPGPRQGISILSIDSMYARDDQCLGKALYSLAGLMGIPPHFLTD